MTACAIVLAGFFIGLGIDAGLTKIADALRERQS